MNEVQKLMLAMFSELVVGLLFLSLWMKLLFNGRWEGIFLSIPMVILAPLVARLVLGKSW